MKHFDKNRVIHTVLGIGVFTVAMVLLAPILLIFTESKDGSITIWNFVGIAYLLTVVWLAERWNKYHKSNG